MNEMEIAYRKYLQMERDREKSYLNSRQGRLESSMLSLDHQMSLKGDPGKMPMLSDRGAGAEAMYASLDRSEEEEELETANQDFVYLLIFEGMLVLCEYERLLPIVEQIVKNGRNRQESIASLSIERRKKHGAAKRFYDRGVQDLLRLISPNKTRG